MEELEEEILKDLGYNENENKDLLAVEQVDYLTVEKNRKK